jgi:hypothetical protein
MARKDNKWMQSAVKKRGAFTEWCKRKGYKGVTSECIREGKKSKDSTTRKRAVLAETFKRYGKRKTKR